MQTQQQELPPTSFPIDPLGFLFKTHPTTVDVDIQVPRCPCGKSPLRCPKPDNCEMEDL